MVLRSALLLGAAVTILGGCSHDGKTAPVSGVVTLNGKPVADVAVTFQPMATEGNNRPGPSAFGVTGRDGRYTAKIIGEETKGATVGKNHVRFSAYFAPADSSDEAWAKAKPKVNIPVRYWSEAKIEFDVPPKGTSSADFQLTSP